MNELQVLREVRSLLETNWHAGRNRFGSSYCLVGGINKVTRVSMDLSSEQRPLFPWGRRRTRARVIKMIEDRTPYGHVENFNDSHGKKAVLRLLDQLIVDLEPKDMDTGKPEKEYTVEPAEPVPGIKESPAPTPEPRKEPAKPEREKVPA